MHFDLAGPEKEEIWIIDAPRGMGYRKLQKTLTFATAEDHQGNPEQSSSIVTVIF